MTTDRPGKVVVNTDGGARGNPGPAAIGAVIKRPGGEVLAEISEAIGPATNNVAEYTAVLRALERAAELEAESIVVRSDSQLLVEQLNGRYRVKNPTLKVLHERVRLVARSFTRVEYEHVPRERNTQADALVNEALDAWIAEHGMPEVGGPRQGSLLEPG